MAGIQASGVGSGLDVNSLVQQLVAAERVPLEQRITRREAAVTVKLSALGTLKGALATLRDGLATLKTTDSFRARGVSSSDPTVVIASVASSAAIGSYRVEVEQLAKSHRLATSPYAGGSTSVVGDGTLTIALGSASFSVDIAAGDDSLADIRDAINASTTNVGVSASIVNETGGSRLVLTSTKTGAANEIKVTTSGGNGGLAALTYDPDDALVAENLQEVDAAADAIVHVNGFEHHADSNTVTTAVDGITFSLKSAKPGTEIDVSVTNDQTTVVNRIKKLVTDFNGLAKQFAALQSYDPTSRKAGPLLGDTFTRSTEAALRRELTDSIDNGNYDSLATVGIKTDASGALVVDEAKLTAALNADYEAVARLFAGTEGVAKKLGTRLDALLAVDGPLTTRTNSLNDQVKALGRDKEQVALRIASIESRYRAQFAALDRLMSQMQSTGNYLAQQLGNLNSG